MLARMENTCRIESGPAGPIAVTGSLDTAMRLLAQQPTAYAVVFERTWPAVDRSRQRAADAGLERRLSIHHADAARLAAWRRAVA